MNGLKLLSWGLRKSIVITTFVGLIGLNVLTLTNNTVHDALFNLIDNVVPNTWTKNSPSKRYKQVANENVRLGQKSRVKANKAKSIANKIAKRSIRNVSVNTMAVVGEAVPMLGIATIVGVTAMDVADGCNTMKDLDEMMSAFEFQVNGKETSKVCGMKVPSKKEVVASIKNGTKERWEKINDAVGGTIHEIMVSDKFNDSV